MGCNCRETTVIYQRSLSAGLYARKRSLKARDPSPTPTHHSQVARANYHLWITRAVYATASRDSNGAAGASSIALAWIYVDGEHRQVRARQGDRKEAEVLWQVIINRLPTTANFRQLAQREIPIFVLESTA